ncbi:MAG: hypothetical protein WA851_01975 [Xanthobacteraceae bacterium]
MLATQTGLRRLLSGLLARVLLATAALLTTLTALLAALILILLIHWKVPLGFCRRTLFNVETLILVPVRTTLCVSRGNLTSSIRGLEL